MPSSADTFRIRIWWERADETENSVYDNGVEQPIARGMITVFKGL